MSPLPSLHNSDVTLRDLTPKSLSGASGVSLARSRLLMVLRITVGLGLGLGLRFRVLGHKVPSIKTHQLPDPDTDLKTLPTTMGNV